MDKIWTTRYRLLTSPLRMLPSFIIPGETKCGTTTFFRCLEKHPDIASPDKKEPNNFIRYGGTSVFCRMHFPLCFRKLLSPRLITGEASVEYLSKRQVPLAIQELLPDVKLIFLLRNPVRRALSDYLMMKDSGREPEEFDSVIARTVSWLKDDTLARLVNVARGTDDTPLRYLTKGCYAHNLKPWLCSFPKENIMVIKSERFFMEPQTVLDEVFGFLKLRSFKVGNVPHHRKARLEVPVSKATIRLMEDFFSTEVKELQHMLGREFDWSEDTKDMLAAGN